MSLEAVLAAIEAGDLSPIATTHKLVKIGPWTHVAEHGSLKGQIGFRDPLCPCLKKQCIPVSKGCKMSKPLNIYQGNKTDFFMQAHP